jgi:hypothetical protein
MKGASVGYLPQEGLSLYGRGVFAKCVSVFAGVLALEQNGKPSRTSVERRRDCRMFYSTHGS